MGLHLLDQLLPLYKQIGEETCLRFQTGSVTKPRLLLSLPEGFVPAPRLLPSDMDRFLASLIHLLRIPGTADVITQVHSSMVHGYARGLEGGNGGRAELQQ